MKRTADLIRLDALPQRPARLRVDRTFPGRIQGVSLLTSGPAAGHGFSVDRTTVEQVAEFAAGTRGRWTHGGLSDDGLGRHLGRWEGVRAEPFWLCRACTSEEAGPLCAACQEETEVAWRAVGDFAFAGSAHKLRPDGLHVPAPVYLMDRAEEDPESLGISVVARFRFAEAQGDEERSEHKRLARVAAKRDLKRADWVADPAANPIGLHAGTDAPSELAEGATRALDRIVAREGRSTARLRALAFLARYFGDEAEADDPQDDPDSNPRARLEAQDEELAALRETVASLQAAEEARKRGAADAYLEELRVRSAALNAPIPAPDLERVARHLAAGDTDTARALGELLLVRSQAQREPAFQHEEVRSLGLDTDRRKAEVNAQAYALRQRGFLVELSPDGTQILKTTPPKDGTP